MANAPGHHPDDRETWGKAAAELARLAGERDAFRAELAISRGQCRNHHQLPGANRGRSPVRARCSRTFPTYKLATVKTVAALFGCSEEMARRALNSGHESETS